MTSKIRFFKVLFGVAALLLLYFWVEPCSNTTPCFYVHSFIAAVITCYTSFNIVLLYEPKRNSNYLLSFAECFVITICLRVLRDVGLCDTENALCRQRLLPLILIYTFAVLILTAIEAIYLACVKTPNNKKEDK